MKERRDPGQKGEILLGFVLRESTHTSFLLAYSTISNLFHFPFEVCLNENNILKVYFFKVSSFKSQISQVGEPIKELIFLMVSKPFSLECRLE